MKNKKAKLIALLAAIAALSLFGACKKEAEGGTSAPESSAEKSDKYISEGWSLSGNPSDYYFLNMATNELVTSFADTARRVEQGEFVTFSAPIVLDGCGELLSVTATIKNKATGETVAAVNGGFFAEALGGYTIEYAFTVNGTAKIISTDITLKDTDKYVSGGWVVEKLGLFTALDVLSVDLTSSTYDCEEDMTAAEKEALTSNTSVDWILLNAVGDYWNLTSTTISFDELAPANYLLLGKLGSEYVYAKNYDFFGEEVDWNSMENQNYFRVYNESENTKLSFVDISEMDFSGDRTGTYAKIESGLVGNSEEYSFNLLPYHQDYSRYVGQNYQIKLDVYFTASDPNRTITQAGTKEWNWEKEKVDRNSQNLVEKWITFSLPLDEYGKGWNNLLTVEQVFYPTIPGMPGTSDVAFLTDYSATYVGNVRMVPVVETVVGEGEYLVDVKNKTTIDLHDYITPQGKALLADYEPTYVLSSVDGKVVKQSATNLLQVSELDMRNYRLSVMLGKETVLYEGTNVDFYHSDDEVVLGDRGRLYKSGDISVGFLGYGAPEGDSTADAFLITDLTGEAYFRILPQHSKAYYEKFASYNLSYSMYTDVKTYDDKTVSYVKHGYFGTWDQSGNTVGKWYDINQKLGESKTVQWLLDNWDRYNQGNTGLYTFGGFAALTESGSTYATENITFYIGKFIVEPKIQGIADTATHLVDVKGKTQIDLHDYITPEGLGAITEFGNASYVLTPVDGGEAKTFASNSISLSEVEKKAYALTVLYNGKKVIYGGTVVDLYDSNEDVVLGYEPMLTTFANGTVEANATASDGTTGVYKFSGLYVDDWKHWGVKLIHTKAYYEKYKDYTISYDLYTDTTTTDGRTINALCHGYFGNRDQSNNTVGKWFDVSKHTVKTVQWLLDNWDNYQQSKTGLYLQAPYVQTTAWSKEDMANVVFYIKDIRVYPTITAVTDTSEQLVDVKGKTTVDLQDYITSEGKTAIAKYGRASYVLTPVNGSLVKTFDSSVITLSEVENRAYTLSVLYNGKDVLYSGTVVDFYDGDEGVVLGYESISASFAGGTVEANATASDGTTGVFKFAGVKESNKYWGIKLIHSKAYYEKYKDYVLTYDIFTDTTASNGGTVEAVRHNYFGIYGNSADGSALATLDGWYDVSTKHADTKKTVQWLLDNWDAYNAGTTGLYGSLCYAKIDGTTNAANMEYVVFYIKVRVMEE